MQQLELEKTYLTKYIPKGIANSKKIEVVDIYIPINREHSKLRIRKNGDKYEITKKIQLDKNNASQQTEHTISLDSEEYAVLASIPGRKVEKNRYYYDYQGKVAEIDVFKGDLAGLVLVDFEFDTVEELENFTLPNFCLADVTQEEFIAGGKLCGKTYKEIEYKLKIFNYSQLTLA